MPIHASIVLLRTFVFIAFVGLISGLLTACDLANASDSKTYAIATPIPDRPRLSEEEIKAMIHSFVDNRTQNTSGIWRTAVSSWLLSSKSSWKANYLGRGIWKVSGIGLGLGMNTDEMKTLALSEADKSDPMYEVAKAFIESYPEGKEEYEEGVRSEFTKLLLADSRFCDTRRLPKGTDLFTYSNLGVWRVYESSKLVEPSNVYAQAFLNCTDFLSNFQNKNR